MNIGLGRVSRMIHNGDSWYTEMIAMRLHQPLDSFSPSQLSKMSWEMNHGHHLSANEWYYTQSPRCENEFLLFILNKWMNSMPFEWKIPRNRSCARAEISSFQPIQAFPCWPVFFVGNNWQLNRFTHRRRTVPHTHTSNQPIHPSIHLSMVQMKINRVRCKAQNRLIFI